MNIRIAWIILVKIRNFFLSNLSAKNPDGKGITEDNIIEIPIISTYNGKELDKSRYAIAILYINPEICIKDVDNQ